MQRTWRWFGPDDHLLQRKGAEQDYSSEQLRRAQAAFEQMDAATKAGLIANVAAGLPGANDTGPQPRWVTPRAAATRRVPPPGVLRAPDAGARVDQARSAYLALDLSLGRGQATATQIVSELAQFTPGREFSHNQSSASAIVCSGVGPMPA